MTTQPATPMPEPIDLTDAIARTIDGALMRGTPVAVAYVDESGRPHLSLRGTVQAFGRTRLALWARSSELPRAIATNPNVALLYHDMKDRTVLMFTGRARSDSTRDVRDRVFEGSPDGERAQDRTRSGTAVVIDLETVRGRTSTGPVHMARRGPR